MQIIVGCSPQHIVSTRFGGKPTMQSFIQAWSRIEKKKKMFLSMIKSFSSWFYKAFKASATEIWKVNVSANAAHATCVVLGYIESVCLSVVQYRALSSKWVNQPLGEL